ncbi:MAG: cobaltochelatase subunit CobN [Rhodomicrobium sp.]|nr:MAG: cobaltochelatase subunit CobN [Rhodomicrobium sp.]
MHLLTAQAGTVEDGKDPIDLAQTPGDIVVLTSADTEIAGLAKAQNAMSAECPDHSSLRLANLLYLSHNYSVDLYLEQTLKAAKLIIIRVLGGPSYWRYGLDEVTRLARGLGIKLAVVSGSAYQDDTLDSFSTLEKNETERLWAYLVEGGPENYQNFLRYTHHIITPKYPAPASARPLPKAGIYWPEGQLGAALKSVSDMQPHWQPDAPIAVLTFYRALLQSGDLAPIDEMIRALKSAGLNPLPLYASSLKDSTAAAKLTELLAEAKPAIVINTTSFAISNPGQNWHGTLLDKQGAPVIQAILSGSNKTQWQDNPRGLIARDIAMNVALPEIDGRLTSRAISFKAELGRDDNVEANIIGHQPEPGRVGFVASLAANWAKLAHTPVAERRIALILSNYPATDGRIANGVGLDTPAGTITLLKAMQQQGYQVDDIPEDGTSLIKALQHEGNEDHQWPAFPLGSYKAAFASLPQEFQNDVEEKWGPPEQDNALRGRETNSAHFPIRALLLGDMVLGVQPGRGSGLDAKQSHHDGTIPPPHEYIAFYLWLRLAYQMHAIIHMGKHGNLEWMPGKALALSETCTPEILLGATPHIYPFIVNDPGEGAQAKRRTSAVIIDHLTPPLTRAESYGPLKDLEGLVDEYYEAAGVDPRRTSLLGREILDLAVRIGLSKDCEIEEHDCDNTKLQKLDNFLCELKELQIRDGLHIFGNAPTGAQKTNLLLALTRLPRGVGKGADQSLLRALSDDLKLNSDPTESDDSAAPFDPLITDMTALWHGPRPNCLDEITEQSWRTHGDTVERLELLAEQLVSGARKPDAQWAATAPVLENITNDLAPLLESCGALEIKGVLTALNGKFVEPGPSGAPTRGRLDVLPTGRNFYTIDNRTIPTETAWKLGSASAEKIIRAYTQEQGSWPKQIALSAWGTSNMRTGGDDLAQALAFIGTRPTWDSASRRVTGFEIIPLSELKRPRVDILFRISGFFRDAFPAQIDLLQSAISAVAALDEDETMNPLRAHTSARLKDLSSSKTQNRKDADPTDQKLAAARIFSSGEMQYGAGLKDMIHSGNWQSRTELAEEYIAKSHHIYGQDIENDIAAAQNAEQHFRALLKSTNLVVHNQDSREFDLLDSEDFYQFEGGLAAAVENETGSAPTIYHNDHSNPENPRVQTLDQEIAKIVRGRAANPKWIAAIQRHGARGASEMLATVTNLSAFASLTNAVSPSHFEALYEAYLVDEDVRDFLQNHNKPAMQDIAGQFQAAIERGLWQPKRNSTWDYLAQLQQDETE